MCPPHRAQDMATTLYCKKSNFKHKMKKKLLIKKKATFQNQKNQHLPPQDEKNPDMSQFNRPSLCWHSKSGK